MKQKLIELFEWFVLYVLNGEIHLPTKKVRRFIRVHYTYTLNDSRHILAWITNVRYFKTKKETIVEITSHYPGIIIGKGGKDVDRLKSYLQKQLNDESLTITLKDCKLWM